MPLSGSCVTGVYVILNTVTGKRYVGSTGQSFRKRWNIHLCLLRLGTHGNRYLQSSWTKHGEQCFEFSILERCRPAQCFEKEQKWIDKYDSHNPLKGYNLTPAAGSCLGMKLTKEQKQKISKALTGRVFSEETRLKISQAKKGVKLKNPRSAEYRLKLSKALKGLAKTEEHKKKISKAVKLQHRNNGKWASKED